MHHFLVFLRLELDEKGFLPCLRKLFHIIKVLVLLTFEGGMYSLHLVADSNGFFARKVQRKGLYLCASRVAQKLGTIAENLFTRCLKASRLPGLVRRSLTRAGFKVIRLSSRRIGHIAAEMDGFVKERLLTGARVPRAIVFAPKNRPVANREFLRYYAPYAFIVESTFLYNVLSNWNDTLSDGYLPWDYSTGLMPQPVFDYLCPTESAARYPKILADYGARPPVVSFSKADSERGERLLAGLGLPPGAWFVCVHCREPGFHPGEDTSNIRDADIDNYREAMEAIVERGGWCIRMGDPTMKALPRWKGIIDYAHHALRSDWGDVFLAGSCKFILGSASGLAQVSTVFGVPCAIANQVPLSVAYNHGIHDLNIPKFYWCNRTNRILTFEEILTSGLGNLRYTELFKRAGITLIENSQEDIKDLALEMLDFVEGRLVYDEDDQFLQEQVRSFFTPEHYSYHAQGRLGRAFLAKYRNSIWKTKPGFRMQAGQQPTYPLQNAA